MGACDSINDQNLNQTRNPLKNENLQTSPYHNHTHNHTNLTIPNPEKQIEKQELTQTNFYKIETEKNNFNNQINQFKNEITSLNNKIQQNENEKNNFNIQIDQFKNEITNLKNKIQQNENEKNIFNNQIIQFKNEISNLKNKIQQNENEKNILNNQINQFKNEIINLNNKIPEIENKLLYLNKDILNSKQTFFIQINDYKIHYEQKKNKLYEKEEEMNEYKKEIEKLKEQLEQNKIPEPNGLDNIGATCYMNATLQSLSNTPELRNYFLNKYVPNKNKIMSNEFYIVLTNLWKKKNPNKSYPPHSFKNVLSQLNPLFAGIQANDSRDLINFLLERFHKELNEAPNQQNNNYLITQNDQLNEDKMFNLFLNEFKNKYRSIISDLFYGIMETKSKCQGCGNIKYNFQVYSFLEFPLEQVNKYCLIKGQRNNSQSNNKNPDVNLYECFNYYGNVELMKGDNQMFCNICQRNCDALYSTNLYSLPNYLIINLNRGKGAIYECKINYPEKLNLLNFVTFQDGGNTYFELYSVISHIGPSSMSGHFVAYCKYENKWYKYNDSFVTPCTKKNEYNDGMPYILFYKAL